MIDINKQIEFLKRKSKGEKVQYVIAATKENGAVVLGVTKGKRFSFAEYKENFDFRRSR